PIGDESRIDLAVHYTFLDATFETPFTAPSALHPEADDGAIDVTAGARLPSVPRHVVKLALDARLAFGLSAGVSVIANSGQYLRGDEANLFPPVPRCTVVNARAAYRVGSHASVFAVINNLFGAEDSTFGVLGDASEVLGPT